MSGPARPDTRRWMPSTYSPPCAELANGSMVVAPVTAADHDAAQDGDYDLVCVFSPTWWLTTCMPIRSFLKTPTTGALLTGTPFTDYVALHQISKEKITVQRFSGWLSREDGRIALDLTVVIGIALVARGAISLLS